MKGKITAILAAVAIIAFIWFSSRTETAEACGVSGCITAELAVDMEKGLSGRESGRMLFVFGEEGERRIWMKGMLYPLDIIWIDGNFTVTKIEQGELCAEECRIYSGKGKYVLEMEKSAAEREGIRKGDTIEIRGIAG